MLRALAAFTVVIHHAGYDADTIAARYGRSPLDVDRLFDWSFGIHLFFVISGFIMLRTARGFGLRGAPLRFLGRRLLRIAPLYWLMTTLVLIGSLVAPALLNEPVGGWALFFGSYLFVPVARVNGEIRPILGQGWTLDYEMAFYLLFGAAMLLPRRSGVIAVAILLTGLVLLGKAFEPTWPPAVVWTSPLLLEFLFGMGVGLMAESGTMTSRFIGAALAIVGVAAAVVLGPAGVLAAPVATVWSEGVPAALILAGCVLMPSWRKTPIVLALSALGDASYSLYLTHPFAIRLLRAAWTATVADRLPPWIFLGGSCLAAVVLSLLVFGLVEALMTAWLNRRFLAIRHRFPAEAARRPV